MLQLYVVEFKTNFQVLADLGRNVLITFMQLAYKNEMYKIDFLAK